MSSYSQNKFEELYLDMRMDCRERTPWGCRRRPKSSGKGLLCCPVKDYTLCPRSDDVAPQEPRQAVILVVCSRRIWEGWYREVAERSMDKYVHVMPNEESGKYAGYEPDRIILHCLITELKKYFWDELSRRAYRKPHCRIVVETPW